MDIFDDVLELLKNDSLSIAGFAVILAYLLWMRWFRYNKRIFLPDDNNHSAEAEQRRLNDLAARRRWIEERQFETIYLDLLGHMLDWVAACFTHDQERLEQNRPEKGWAKTLFGVQPFTENSYLLCLRLATIYPWLVFFLVWLAGGAGEFSGLSLFPTETPLVERMIVGFALVATTWSFWLAFSSGKLDRYRYWRYFITGLVIFVIAYAYAFDFAFAPVFALSYPPPITIAIAMAMAMAPVPALAIVPAPTIILAIAMAVARDFFTTPRAVGGYWIAFNAYYLTLSVASMVWLSSNEGLLGIHILLQIFLVILPLINAFMDWVSLGVTRGFLYAISQRTHHGLMALALVAFDIALALVFLLSIVSITVVVLAGANAAALHWNGAMLIDLHVLLDGLAVDPLALDYTWIHFMMLTTLIPTLIHFAVAGASAVMVFPNRWRESILRHWDKRGDAQTAALWYITLVPALGLIAPLLALYGLYALLSAHGRAAGMLLLDWARTLSVMFD